MITGKVYSMHDPEGKPAVRLGPSVEGWSLVLVITPPSPTFPGLNREEHIFAGESMVHEAIDLDNLPSDDELSNLQHLIYIKNS